MLVICLNLINSFNWLIGTKINNQLYSIDLIRSNDQLNELFKLTKLAHLLN